MKKIILVFSLLLFIVSCESDSIENTNPIITGYKITSITDYTNPAQPDYESIVIGNLLNGKLFSETTEEFLNGVSQGTPTTIQRYFYTGNRLDQRFSGNNLMEYFYYDANGNLIGSKGVLISPATTTYGRYVYQPNNVVYCETLNLPYNDPNAIASNRIILQLNSDGDVVSAGTDADMDGVAANIYTYSYADGNLVQIQKPDGTIENFSYSNVINTYNYLEQSSCGKQVMQFPNASAFSLGFIYSSALIYSKNITLDEFAGSTGSTYLVMPDGFYNKMMSTNTSSFGNNSLELEYFFN